MFIRNRKVALSLVCLPAAALVLATGCSSSSSTTRSGDSKLKGLSISSASGPLTPSPAFSATGLSYAVTIGGTGPVTLTATAEDPGAVITVNGAVTPSGAACAPINLKLGTNAIPVIVSAPDGSGQTYVVTVTALSQNASLAAITVGGANGGLVPAFNQAIPAYSLQTNFMLNPAPLTVKATLADPNAVMTVNGVALASNTVSAPIPLKVGVNAITIAVKAQDGVTAQSYTLTTNVNAQNTSVRVLDSSNGSPVPSALITVSDASGTVLQSGIPVDANGSTTLGLDGASRYNISALGAGTAQSLFAGFDSSRETVANLYCHPLGMVNFPAQAPQITSISYGPDGTAWTPVTGNVVSDTLANEARIKVTALGASNIATTSWSGFGMGLQVDQPAWAWAYFGAYAVDEQAVPVTSGASTLYRSTMELGVPLLNFVPKSNHFVDLVVYDVANNRTEQKLYLNVTDGAADTTQADLSGFMPSKVTVQLVTHGLSRNIFSLTPVDASPTTYEPDIYFSLLNGSGAAQKILGYDVLRSTDGVAWTKVATHQYTALTTASSLVYTDLDPTLTQGVSYYYKVRAFNGNTTNNGGYSQYSVPVYSSFLPPYTTRLTSPATETLSKTLAPKLAFSITNPALFDPALCDYFYFYLNVTEKTNTAASYGQAYRYNFTAGRFEMSSAGVWVDASAVVTVDTSHSNFTIQTPAGYFQAGVSYQWSIFGTSATTASSFRKYTYPYNDPTSTSYGVALSQGSTYELSYGAVNGYFTLTIDPNAQ